jgi:hypothetical protein
MSIEKSSGLIGNRTRDLPTCSTVPQPTTLSRFHILLSLHKYAGCRSCKGSKRYGRNVILNPNFLINILKLRYISLSNNKLSK